MRFLLFSTALATTLSISAGAQAKVAEPPASANTLKLRINKLIHGSANLQGAKVGVYVQVLKTGRVVYSERGGEPMIPASNLKVVTTAVAIDRLGPNFRYFTELRGGQPDNRGVIPGDVYLRGSGDPTLVLPYSEPTAPWRFFIKQLKAQGVKQIQGDIVADDSAFDREFIGQGWFDRYLLDTYAAPVGALSMNSNCVELTITDRGVTCDPPSLGMQVLNQSKTGGGGDLSVDRLRGSDVTVVKGSIAPGQVVKRSITVANPSMFTVGSFLNSLSKSGIRIKGRHRMIGAFGEPARSDQSHVIARYQSPRLREIISQTNKESDNVFAQHLFKTLGYKTRGQGTAQNSEAAVREFLQKNGVDDSGLIMVDGSGLSTMDRISPRQLVGVLEGMWRHNDGQVFMDSLPGPGEGTMTSRLGGATVRAKTGTLDHHSSLTGYVVSGYGQTLGFSVIVNDVPGTWAAIDLEDHVVRTLANWTQPL